MRRSRLPYVCALFALACTGDPAEPSDPDPVDPVEPTPATLADCDESDMDALPWTGMMFDPTTFEQTGPLPTPYIVATTAGWGRPDEEYQQLLGQYTQLVIEDLFTRDGLLGATLGTSERCGAARTLTVWRDEESLLEFVTGEAHSEAITEALHSTRAWETTHWTETDSDQAPTWDDARAGLAAVRP